VSPHAGSAARYRAAGPTRRVAVGVPLHPLLIAGYASVVDHGRTVLRGHAACSDRETLLDATPAATGVLLLSYAVER
jgi:hypothetical protein